jgi:hypothetical protein
MRSGAILFAAMATLVPAQDKKDKQDEQKTTWQSQEHGFAIRKAGRKPKDFIFDFDKLPENAILRIKHRVIMACVITITCHINKEGRDYKLDDQAKQFDDNIAKNAAVKVDKREKTRMGTGEEAMHWRLARTDEKTADEYEFRVWLWFSAQNKNLYLVEAMVKKGEWDGASKIGKDIQDTINTIQTYKSK